MKKLLVNSESGEQILIEVSPTGSYSDKERVIWDERINGDLPEIELGKMELVGGVLVKKNDFILSHQQYSNTKNQEAIDSKIAQLWQAANDYIFANINGVALSILAAGVNLQKPKALAVAVWSDGIWAEYYARKALVTVDGEPNLDFSGFGAIPYTVLELREEIASLWDKN